jgi:hypothetical protein
MITVLDASNYLRGLLVLIRRDGKISEQERAFVMRAGKSLGFEEGFCANAIHEILENTFIDDSHPIFSSTELAMAFIRDGLSIAYADNECDESEEQWLRATTETNGIPLQWFHAALTNAKRTKEGNYALESESLVIKHHS